MDKQYSTYEEANTAALAHYQNADYAAALAVMDVARTQFPARRVEADYLRTCLAVRLDAQELAWQTLDDLLVDGIWFSEQLLRSSPSLAPVQGLPAFEKRVAAHRTARENDEADSSGTLEIALPDVPVGVPLPLIVLLHGNGSSAGQELKFWQPAVKLGWAVAAPQSEAVFWKGGGGFWADHESAQTQLAAHLTQLRMDHKIDEGCIIFAGFSMGGDVAVAQTLKGLLAKPRGFIAVGPGGPMIDAPETFQPLLQSAQGRMVRCVFFASDADPFIQPDQIKVFAEMCNAHGFMTQYEHYSDPGHVYPNDFDKRLGQILSNFV